MLEIDSYASKNQSGVHPECEEKFMKFIGLTNQLEDKGIRVGDCLILYSSTFVIVYDCGHSSHAKYILNFLQKKSTIDKVNIVISHNDSDHTDGVVDLLEGLYKGKYNNVTVYSHHYQNHAEKIKNGVKDGRRTKTGVQKHLEDEYKNTEEIISVTKVFGFESKEIKLGEEIETGCTIVGPKEKHFYDSVSKAVDNRVNNIVEKGKGSETVKNAPSVQLSCVLEGKTKMLLCGDACPEYLENLDYYDIIQFPHHGQKADGEAVLEKLTCSYNKTFFISDNTGDGVTSGGSDALIDYLKKENYDKVFNTSKKNVNLPLLTPIIKNIGTRLCVG